MYEVPRNYLAKGHNYECRKLVIANFKGLLRLSVVMFNDYVNSPKATFITFVSSITVLVKFSLNFMVKLGIGLWVIL